MSHFATEAFTRLCTLLQAYSLAWQREAVLALSVRWDAGERSDTLYSEILEMPG